MIDYDPDRRSLRQVLAVVERVVALAGGGAAEGMRPGCGSYSGDARLHGTLRRRYTVPSLRGGWLPFTGFASKANSFIVDRRSLFGA